MRFAVLGFLLVALVAPAEASAQFTPIICSSSSWFTVQGFGYSSDEFPTDPNCVASGADPCPHYTPNFTHTRYFLANRYVREVELRFTEVDLESGFDFLHYGVTPFSQSVTEI